MEKNYGFVIMGYGRSLTPPSKIGKGRLRPGLRQTIFPADNTHAHFAYASSPRFVKLRSPCVLELCILLFIGLHAISRLDSGPANGSHVASM